MLHSQHQILAMKDSDEKSRRLMGWGLVAVFHVFVIWALISGLAIKALHIAQHNIEATVILQPETPLRIAAPIVKMVQPSPDSLTVQPPVFTITDPPPTINANPTPTPPATPDSGAMGLFDTHTRPPYPLLATRLGEQGVVQLHVSISAAGDVTAATITKSSGFADLDQSAVVWVIAHWKYTPAVQNGAPVASATDAAVVFNLKNGG